MGHHVQAKQAKSFLVKVYLVLSVVHSNISLLVVSLMKPKYMVTEVSGPGLVVQALRKTSKPHVLTLLFFLTKLTESDKVIYIDILPLPF